MARDDDFEPKLGRIRSRGSRHGGKYLHRVLRAVALAGVGCEAARYRGAARSTAASSDAAPASAGWNVLRREDEPPGGLPPARATARSTR